MENNEKELCDSLDVAQDIEEKDVKEKEVKNVEVKEDEVKEDEVKEAKEENKEVANQESEKKNSKKTKKECKLKHKKVVIPIAIATAILMLVVMFVGNMITNSLVRQVYGKNGLYDAEVILTKKQYDKIKKNKVVTDIEYIDVVKYSLCNGAPFEDRRAGQDGVRVGHLNKMTYDLYCLEMSEGRMPRNSKEIILSKYYDVTDTINVGEWIILEQGKRSAEYKVVGKYEDGIRSFQYNEVEHLMDEYSALTYDPHVKNIDSRVAYVTLDKTKIKGIYEALSGMKIKGDNIYVNHAMEDGINKDAINSFGPFYIIIICLVALVILTTVIVVIVLKSRFLKVISQQIDGNEDKDYVKTIAKTEITNVIWIGLVIGTVASIIINPIFNMTLGKLIYKALVCTTNSIYGTNMLNMFIGMMYSILVVLIAKNASVGKQIDKIVLTSRQLGSKKLVKSIIFSVVLIIVTVVVAYKFKPIVVKNIEPFEKETDYDILIEDWIEDMGESPDDIKKQYSDTLKKSYNDIKSDMKDIGVDSITSLMVHQDNRVRIAKVQCTQEFYVENKDMFTQNKDKYIDMDFEQLYVADDVYREFLKEYKLDENKYIGVEETPAIIINIKESSLDEKKYKIFRTPIKYLKSLHYEYIGMEEKISYGDNILVGDYIYENPKCVEIRKLGYFEGGIYAIYPESAAKNVTYYNLGIDVKDYAKIEDKFTKWASKNDIDLVDKQMNKEIHLDAPIAAYSIKVSENKEKEDTMNKVIASILALAILNIVLAVVRYVLDRKKENK